MSEIRWSPEAADDLVRIVEYIRRDNDNTARRIARAIYDQISTLNDFPSIGRPGRVEGMRVGACASPIYRSVSC
ncbi:MAG TPA: type II toxin-antitoxin system RelE/ParE family toxin [Candidatus Angelobacter sp.]|nr:type II toxin-antitoxin system RelE/ParE family toxin [Candidatus Angelobacter sp.]